MSPSRAIVVGGGHNGLIGALYLAQNGLKVTVLEAREQLGGSIGAWEFGAGHRVPSLTHDINRLSPTVLAELNLSDALKRVDQPPVIVPAKTGRHIKIGGSQLSGDVDRAASEGYLRWKSFAKSVSPFLNRQLEQPPPPLHARGSDLIGLGARAVSLRALGKSRMLELLRVLPMPVADWLRDYFADELLNGGLSLPALFGSFVGPRAAGTAIQLLIQNVQTSGPLDGGPEALIRVLQQRAEESGVEIRTGTPVTEILVEQGRVQGVMAGNDKFSAELVLAASHPVTALTELIDPFIFKVRQLKALEAVRSRGTVAKVHFALEGEFELDTCPGETVSRALLGCDSIDHIERCFDQPKYRQPAEQPVLDVWAIPGRTGNALNSDQVVSVMAFGAPFNLEGGWNQAARDEFSERVITQLERYSKGIRGRIKDLELLTPVDLSSELRLPGGHLYHLESALDQLFVLRPVSFASGYSTSVEGLFLAGSGSHPGGGLCGLPGLLGARQALQSL